MSENSPARKALNIVLEGFPAERESELGPEIFHLNESNAHEALEKIFAADTVAVWGKVG